MRRHALQALLSATGNPFSHEDTQNHDLDDYCLWHGGKPRSSRHHIATSLTQGGGPPQGGQGGAPAQGGGGGDGSGGGENDQKEEGGEEGAEKLEYMMENGKSIMLCGDDQDCCIKSCKEAPELKDDQKGQSTMDSIASVSAGGEQGRVSACASFCSNEFRIQCFPASSTVVARDRGRIPLSSLRLGDFILVICFEGDTRVLRYEPVIAWLHREPELEVEVVKVHHGMGKVSLTTDHLIFTRRPGAPQLDAVAAHEVAVGDRVLAPWIDGGLSEPEVTSVEKQMAQGAYAPLTPSGTLLVDGTAVSCYIAPNDLFTSPTYAAFLNGLKRLNGKENAHELAHMVMLPVRLLHQSATQWQSLVGDGKDSKPKQSLEDFSTVKDIATAPQTKSVEDHVHPYGLFLYVVCKSFVV